MPITNILKHLAGPVIPVPDGPHVTIRRAVPADAGALATLAALDSSRPLRGAVLLAEQGDELWAAISLDDSHVIANPFRPSGELAFMLLERARGLRRAERRQRRQLASAGGPPNPISLPSGSR
jgi:hypothetical protein